jgi:hypothetical protein
VQPGIGVSVTPSSITPHVDYVGGRGGGALRLPFTLHLFVYSCLVSLNNGTSAAGSSVSQPLYFDILNYNAFIHI